MTGTCWFRPNILVWRGTPIPPVQMPLSPSPEREHIAGAVWWNGPPWTILRNGPQFVRQVLDFGSDDQVAFICCDIERPVWVSALSDALPGEISRRARILWSVKLGLMPADADCDWPTNAHIRDVRPLANHTRQQLYERFRLRHERIMAERRVANLEDEQSD